MGNKSLQLGFLPFVFTSFSSEGDKSSTYMYIHVSLDLVTEIGPKITLIMVLPWLLLLCMYNILSTTTSNQ